MIRITITEPITSLNKGEVAILEGIYEALRLVGDFRLTVFSPPEWFEDDKRNYAGKYHVVSGTDLLNVVDSYQDPWPEYGRMVTIKKWGRLLVFSLLARVSGRLARFLIKDDLFHEMSKSDFLIAGHDGMFSYDDFWVVFSANLMGKPIALYGGGCDGNTRKKWRLRKFYQYAVKNAALCTVRDEGTQKFLVMNDVPADKVHLFPDPAFLMQPSPEDKVLEILEYEGVGKDKYPLLGLVPVRGGIVYSQSFTSVANKEDKHKMRTALWKEMLEELIEKTDAHLMFLPHCIGPTEDNDDRRMSRDIYDSLKAHHDRITIIEKEYGAQELKGMIAQCDFVIGERTHALIGALSTATPCLSLTVKEDQRMHKIVKKMFGRTTININDPNSQDIKNTVVKEWHQRKEIKAAMEEKRRVIEKQAQASAELLKAAIEDNIKSKN